VTWPERSVMPDSGRRSVYLADLLREITPKTPQRLGLPTVQEKSEQKCKPPSATISAASFNG
jgi:hypothetical protein